MTSHERQLVGLAGRGQSSKGKERVYWGQCLFQLTLQNMNMDFPLQTSALIKFHPAPVITRVLFFPAASRQRQVPLFKVWCRNQSRVFICFLPALRILQRQRENPLRIGRHVARVCLWEEVPVYSLESHGLDLLPGDVGGNGTWDGKRWGVWCVPLIWSRSGEVCVGEKTFLSGLILFSSIVFLTFHCSFIINVCYVINKSFVNNIKL